MRRRDGQLLWVQVSKRLVVEDDPSGGMIASYVNVDARHRAEQAVALQAERTQGDPRLGARRHRHRRTARASSG